MSSIQNLFFKALQLHQSGRLRESIGLYLQILPLRSSDAQFRCLLGTAYLQIGQFEAAIDHLRKSLELNPGSLSAYNNLGSALQNMKRLDEALASYDKALVLKPDSAEAHYNRGHVLQNMRRLDEALASYRKALVLKPDYADAYYNQGNVLHDLKRLDEAVASYDRALVHKPGHAEAYWNKSLAMISKGIYREGWELYEWRLKKEDTKDAYYSFPLQAWRGQKDIRGMKLLIQAEQGFGDTIQFCRYLSQTVLLGAEIIFEVPAPLLSFVSTLNCPMTIIAKGTALPEFDAYCPLMSLPYVFKTTVETIPSDIPYLSSDSNKVKAWQEKLGNKDKLRVGLVWSGSSAHSKDFDRSLSLRELLSLIDLPIEWHSLQKEYRQSDLEVLNLHQAIQQHQDDLEDFSDTAALIECLDLVISVDTSVAHVAGALGKPVWILLPFMSDYRWMLDRGDSPWYPTAKLFRQPAAGDWQTVISSVASSLGGVGQVLNL